MGSYVVSIVGDERGLSGTVQDLETGRVLDFADAGALVEALKAGQPASRDHGLAAGQAGGAARGPDGEIVRRRRPAL